MIYTEDNLKYAMAGPLEWFAQWREEMAEQGFRPISLSLCGPTSVPIYSAVVVKLPSPFRSKSWHRLSKRELLDKIDEMAALDRPLHPYLLAATGSGSDVIYAVSFREMLEAPEVRVNMFPATFKDRMKAAREAGLIPISIDSFGSAEDIRYCAVWAANPNRVAWNSEAINDFNPRRQERFEAMTSIGCRAALVAMTPSGGVARIFVDSRLRHSHHSSSDMSGHTFSTVLDNQKKEGRFPVHIATTVLNDGVHYSAIFAESDEILPRTFRIRGPEPVGLTAVNRARAADIDAWMETYVRAHNFRGAAIAVVEGTRLVYAKGYTHAEANTHYRDIEPTTLFRMASVSKLFAALAAWKALAEERSYVPATKMQDVLNLKKTDGTAPGGDFGDIEIRHLLESNSGIDQGIVRDKTVYPTAKDPNGATQPLTIADIKRAIADAPMVGTPGHADQYGRTDYILLGLAAAGMIGHPSFTSALQTLLLDPLRMTRTRGARSKIEDRGDDEAMQHSPDLSTGISAVHNDRRLVPTAYGVDNYEVYGGAGGLSSAVVDLARLGAMLNCRLANPVFSRTEVEDLIDAALAATSAGTSHGYYGFDAATRDNAGVITVNKGGGLSAVGAGIWGRIGGRFIAVARNGEKVEGAPVPWNTDIDAIAATIDWGTGDLFPQFGMPSLGLRMVPGPPIGQVVIRGKKKAPR